MTSQRRQQLQALKRQAAAKGKLLVKVQCPEDVSEGMKLSIRHPHNGKLFSVRVPQGVDAGTVFHAMVDPA